MMMANIKTKSAPIVQKMAGFIPEKEEEPSLAPVTLLGSITTSNSLIVSFLYLSFYIG